MAFAVNNIISPLTAVAGSHSEVKEQLACPGYVPAFDIRGEGLTVRHSARLAKPVPSSLYAPCCVYIFSIYREKLLLK